MNYFLLKVGEIQENRSEPVSSSSDHLMFSILLSGTTIFPLFNHSLFTEPHSESNVACIAVSTHRYYLRSNSEH